MILFSISKSEPFWTGLISLSAIAKSVWLIIEERISPLIMMLESPFTDGISGYSSADIPIILKSTASLMIVVISFSLVSILTVSAGSLLTISEMSFALRTTEPSESTSAGRVVVIPSSRSYPHKVSEFALALKSIPSRAGLFDFVETAL